MSDRPDLTDDVRLARAEGLVASDFNDEVVILNIESGHFYHLNATGSRIWTMLNAPMTFSALCAEIHERFAVDADECRRSVTEFVQGMLARGLLERA